MNLTENQSKFDLLINYFKIVNEMKIINFLKSCTLSFLLSITCVIVIYKITVEADKNKDSIWRLISKNLMNSLYGRFGMDQYLINSAVIDKDEF